MARIRSIHPGLLTDEAFMALGHAAFRLYMGLLMEADDQGVFEWKPITLKARILPAHNEDVIALLAELTVAGVVRQYTANGKAYGAIRNFMKWQRPRRPTYSHPVPIDIAAFVGKPTEQTDSIPGNVGNDPPSTDNPPDIDGKVSADGGGRMEEEGGRRKNYIFAGSVVKLVARDYSNWRKAYSAIPDFNAELRRIDIALSARPVDNWFVAASNMLAAKHQKFQAQRSQPPPRSRVTPIGVGG